MQNLKTKKRVFPKKKWGSPKKKGSPLSNKKPGLMVRFFVAHNHPSSNHPSSFVTESGFPVTTEVRWDAQRGAEGHLSQIAGFR